jgi:hypothetical protein
LLDAVADHGFPGVHGWRGAEQDAQRARFGRVDKVYRATVFVYTILLILRASGAMRPTRFGGARLAGIGSSRTLRLMAHPAPSAQQPPDFLAKIERPVAGCRSRARPSSRVSNAPMANRD